MHKSIAPISLLALLAVNPAQAAPTQITACGTISQSGSYVLAQNLFAASGNCLVIAAIGVTIDLAGFTITGTGTGTGVTAISPNFFDITVRNGTITGFHSGVFFPTGGGHVIEGLRVDTSFGPDEDVGPGTGITAEGIVKDNQVSGGKARGIRAGGIVTGNSAISLSGTAMSVSFGSTVIGNTVFGGAQGMVVTCPSNVTDNMSAADRDSLVLEGEGCNNTNNVAP